MPKSENNTVKISLVAVRVIRRKDQAALVEWIDPAGIVRRVTVPAGALTLSDDGQSGSLTADELAMGIEYGIPWESFLSALTLTPSELARALRNAGVWTVEDYERNPGALQSAMLDAVRAAFEDVARSVKHYKARASENQSQEK